MLDALLERAREDHNVIGIVVFGSRGKSACVTPESDWDVFAVVREHRGDYPSSHGDQLETVEKTLDEIRHPPGWNRYAFAWLEPQLDKTGDVAEALLEAVTVDPASAGQPLDAYVNMVYRSVKNSTLSLERASLLDAQESIPWYLEFVFAVHGRVRPFTNGSSGNSNDIRSRVPSSSTGWNASRARAL